MVWTDFLVPVSVLFIVVIFLIRSREWLSSMLDNITGGIDQMAGYG